MKIFSFFSSDRSGSRYYFTTNERNETVDHGVVVDVNGVDKLESTKTVDALHIFGDRFDNLIDGDRAPEWDGKQDWERFDLADVIFITLGFDGFDLDRRLRDCGVDIPVATAGSSPEDEHGQRRLYTPHWARYWKQARAKGKCVYIVGNKEDELDEMKEAAQYAVGNGARAFLVDIASLLPNDSTTQIKTIDWLEVAKGNARDVFFTLLDSVSEEWKGRDDDRLREAIRAAKECADDRNEDWTQDVDLPPRMQKAARAIADKFHAPIRSVAAMLICAFLARQGHERARLKRGGSVVYPYLGVNVVGESGAGKSPIMKMVVAPLRDLDRLEGERARERKKNLEPLKKARKSASDNLAKAELATKTAKGEANKERRAEELAREIWESTDRDYRRANAPAHKSLLKYASAQGVKLDLARNADAARTLDEVNDGALIWLDEGARLLAITQGASYGLDVFAAISELLDVTTNGGTTAKGEGAADKYDADLEIGAAILAAIQPGTIRADKIDSISAQGGLNRFFWVYLPYAWKATKLDDITNALAPWYSLFKIVFPPNEYRLGDAADRVYQEWRDNDLQRLRNEAKRRGDDTKVAFLSKLDESVLRVALGFHLILEATKIDDGLATLPELIIGADVMRMAIDFCRAMIEERDKTFRQIGFARESRDKRRLSQDAQKVYDYLVTRGNWCSLTEIQAACNCYRDAAKRDVIDQELIEAGLMIIGKHEQKDKRHAVIIEAVETKRAA